MKNIVVPIDFSDGSINALHHAIDFANVYEAGITMVHVLKKKSIYNSKFGLQPVISNQDNKLVDRFNTLLESFKNKARFKLNYQLRKGKIFQEIITYAKYHDSFMIIMGTHGISGFEERWIGSNAYRVVSNAPCPVMTIRMDYPIKGIGNVALLIDNTEESRQKVPFLADIAHRFNAEIHILALSENKKKAANEKLNYFIDQAELFLDKAEVKYKTEKLIGKNRVDMIIEYALSQGVHLIGAMTEQTESSKNIWLGTYAQQLVNHSPIPVVSLRPF